MSIGERIYDLRKKKLMSQEDLANVLNVSRQTISKWETGESTPDFDKIVPLCDFFEISTDELLKGKKNLEIIKEPEKKRSSALTFTLCLLIFWIMVILLINLDAHGASDTIIASVSVFCIAAISIIFTNYLCTRKSSFYNISKDKNKKRLINKIFNSIIILLYFSFSIIFDSWFYSWVIILIGIIIKRIIELILLLKEEENEK